jgi:hypothetical protein
MEAPATSTSMLENDCLFETIEIPCRRWQVKGTGFVSRRHRDLLCDRTYSQPVLGLLALKLYM